MRRALGTAALAALVVGILAADAVYAVWRYDTCMSVLHAHAYCLYGGR